MRRRSGLLASRKLLAPLLLVAGLTGCLYGFAGGGLPPSIKTVALLPFDNQTAEPTLTQEVQSSVREAVERRLGLRQASESQADAVVRGTIVRYEPDLPVQYIGGEDRTVSVTRRLVQITVSVEILDQKAEQAALAAQRPRARGGVRSRAGAGGTQHRAGQAGDQHRGRSPVPMVSLHRGLRGASMLGCLVSVVLFLGALYYGVHIGGVYWRYYQLLDDMRQQARHADQFTDDVIQKHLAAQADSLLGQTPDFRIKRGGRPSRITIQTEYTETVALPGFNHTFMLRPHAEEPL